MCFNNEQKGTALFRFILKFAPPPLWRLYSDSAGGGGGGGPSTFSHSKYFKNLHV